MKRLAIVVLLALATTSCASFVNTKTIAFYEPTYSARGSIAVVPYTDELLRSQGFELYLGKIEDQLLKSGYKISSNPADAEQLAIISYGFDAAPERSVSKPPKRQQSSVGWVNPRSGPTGTPGTGTNYTMPTYSLGGSESLPVTAYRRVFAMDILDSFSLNTDEPITLLKIRTTSEGNCSIISEVMDELIEATFTDFPPTNGKTITRIIDAENDC
jgi:hypothetical protein